MPQLRILVESEGYESFVLKAQYEVLLKITYSFEVVSVHRDPDRAMKRIQAAVNDPQTKVIIGVAASATGLPGVIAGMVRECAKKILVLGVRFEANPGMRAIEDMSFGLSMMPEGVPLAYTGYNEKGFLHACLLAVRIIDG
jgi:phosphoribosylcarboxyaminoimidazole (NCAIR) mutase